MIEFMSLEFALFMSYLNSLFCKKNESWMELSGASRSHLPEGALHGAVQDGQIL